MNDAAVQIASEEERDLIARLVRMGAVAPVNFAALSRDQVEEITAGLPTVYECRYSVSDMDRREREIRCCDLSPEAVNRQFFRRMAGEKMSSFPTQKLETSYSPETWSAYLHQEFGQVEADTLRERFSQWGIPLAPESLKDGFCRDQAENRRVAQEMFHDTRTELFARLICTEVVEPFDFERISGLEAEDRINTLPALLCSECIWKEGDDFHRAKFYNVAEFNIKEVHHVENDWGYYDDPELTGMAEEVIRSGSGTLRLQERRFFDERGIDPETIVHHGETVTGKYDWLNYFKQDLSSALPDGRTTALKNAFKNWGFNTRKSRFEKAFEPDAGVCRSNAALLFRKALISKVVNAGIVPPMPHQAWKKLSPESGKTFIDKIPLLPEMEHPGEWLEFFQQKPPDNALEWVQMQNRFEEAGVPFDEKSVRNAFPNQENKTKTSEKGFRTMQDITLEDYRKMIGRLTSSGRLERMDKETWEQLTLEDARDYVRGFDEEASPKQQLLITTMNEEERISMNPEEISALSRMEASFIIDNAPQRAIPKEAPDNPISDETRRELKSLMDKEEIPRIPYVQWKNLSEEEGRQKIEHAYSRRNASEKQKDFVRQALKDKTISGKILKTVFKTPTISEQQLDELSFLQATRLIGSLPATEKQIEAVRNLVAEKRLEPLDDYKLSTAEASRILEKAYKDTPERDPDGPASVNQKETLIKLIENRAIPEMDREQIENLTFGEAGKLLENAPATRPQKTIIARFVQEEKLSRIPNEEFNSMTRAEASKLIDIGLGKLPRSEQKITPESEIPATEAQRKVLDELLEKGKIPEIPENISKEAASQMIKDAVSADPITQRQMDIIEKRIANHQIPPMTREQKAKLTQKEFSELMKVQPKSQKTPAPENAREKSKTPEMAR